jgi:hypothetical protein
MGEGRGEGIFHPSRAHISPELGFAS